VSRDPKGNPRRGALADDRAATRRRGPRPIASSRATTVERSSSEHALQRAALAVSAAGGPQVYRTLVAELAEILRVDVAFVAVFSDAGRTRMRSLAAILDGRPLRNFDYQLAGSPCAQVVGRDFRYVARGVAAEFPSGTIFAAKGMDCYAAYPLSAAAGDPLGLLVTMNRRAMADAMLAESVLQIFAVRIAAEIERGRAEDALRRAALAVSGAAGDNVYRELVRVLATILGVEIAFIALPKPDDPCRLKMLAFYKDGRIVEDFEYPMLGTPCEQVLRSGYGAYPDRLTERFPLDADFKAIGAESYAGLSLTGADGSPFGLIAVVSRKPLPNPELVESMLKIFAARARTEIERARGEAALRASEEQYRAIFNASADALVLWDSSLRRVDVNPAYERIYGYTREEVLSDHHTDGLPPEYAERRRDLVRRTLAGESCVAELESVRRDGGRVEVEVRTIPILHRGEPHVLAIVRDMTERKRAEEALRDSEAQYRAIFNASADAMVLWDSRLLRVDVNPAYERMYGWTRDEMIGRGYEHTGFPPEYIRLRQDLVRRALAGETARAELEAIRKKGDRLQTEMVAIPFRHRGEPHVLAIARDITERKRAEAALRDSEAQYRTIFNASADALVLRDADFRIIDVNSTYETWTGISREQAIGADRVLANPPGVNERVKAMHGRVLAGEPIALETQLLHRDGSSRDLELRGMPIRHRGAPHVLYAGRDITERKRAESDRQALEAQLRQAQKMEAIGQLTGGIAHDFNNILQSIVGYVVLAQDRQDALGDAQLGRYLEQVHTAAQRAGELIRQMLTFSRGRHGERRPLSVAPLVAEATRMLRSTLPSTIVLDTSAVAEVPAALIDPVQIEQVLLNLSINARDAMRNVGEIFVSTGTVDAREAVCASCRQRIAGRFVELLVRDTGPGIPANVAERMFEPFFTTKEVGKGSGMGLAMVHGIVHDHGGHILLDCAAGEGTTIRVLFPPLESAAQEALARGERRRAAERKPSLKGAVLIAEDEAVIRDLMRDLLTGWGLDVAVAPTGVEAAAALAAGPQRFDLVLTDQTMPGMTGLALSREATRLRPGMPVLLCTGFGEDISAADLAAAGVRALVRKPVEPGDLYALLRRHLDARAAGA
jgi:PAS domain S-box-containing protein